MIFGSVCSGIEAASVAWHPLGWRAAFVSEIDKFPSAVLAHHYPDVPNHGDMTKFKEWPDAAIDVLVGGTPCQSFSVAGLRKGLDDPRGNLTLTYLAVAAKYRPKWLVWENVPGVLSDATGAFGAFLGGLGQLGYGFAYRILDAQYFGVPQRRRRVFVVGCLGDWRAAAAVLFERHSLQGHPAPSREAGKRVAGTVKGGSGSRGYPDPSDGNGGGLTVAQPLRAQAQASHRLDSDTYIPHTVGALTDGAHMGGGLTGRTHTAVESSLSRCLNAGGMGRQDYETETLIPTTGGGFDVAHSLRADGFDASEDGTGRGTPLVPVAFAQNQRDEVREMEVAGALAGEPGMKQQTYIAFGWQNSSQQGASASASHTPTLDKSKVPAVSFMAGQGAKARSLDIKTEQTPSLKASNSGLNTSPAVMLGMQVRRLTPRECERLQGFHDDYTLITYRNKPAADGPRYKALGNSMAVPVMRWIGERVQMVEELSHD